MEESEPIERLRRRRRLLLKAYVLHVGWFVSMCASAATDATPISTALSFWLALATVPPVLICAFRVHKAIRAIEPNAPSAGLVQMIVATLLFTPFESGLVLPARNLWISRRILREWDNAQTDNNHRPAPSVPP